MMILENNNHSMKFGFKAKITKHLQKYLYNIKKL